jgi:glycine oxidase
MPQFNNVWINAGQFRNGLVLAPASATLLADLILAREPFVNPEPYQVL